MSITMENIICAWCGKQVEKVKSELNRQRAKGRHYFFCSGSCSAFYNNRATGHKVYPIDKVCPVCNKIFTTNTGARSATFCSRSCASKGSVNENRRRAAKKGRENLIYGIKSIALAMKSREAWKYKELKKFLIYKEINHEFEEIVENFIRDLVLWDKKLIIEFDGPDHKYRKNSIKMLTFIDKLCNI